MKKMTFVLVFLMVAGILATAVMAADFTVDTTTRGDWVGKYGSEGYFIPGGTYDELVQKLPDYATVTVTDLMGGDCQQCWCWWDESTGAACETDPVNALWVDEAKTYRRAACFYLADVIDLTIDIGDQTKLVSLYINDFDGPYNTDVSRACDLALLDADGNEIAYTYVENFENGMYFTYEVTGQVTFDLVKAIGANVVINGLFIDPLPGEAAAEPAAEEVVEEPVAEEVVVEEPVVEEVVVEEPAVEEPVVEEVVVEEPVIEEVVVEEAVVTAAPEAEVTAAAPQTADFILLAVIASIVSCGTAMTSKKRR